MKNKKILNSVRSQVQKSVEQYNEENKTQYLIHFRSAFAYLERVDKNGKTTKIGRLKYQPKTKEWDFAVFKYSSERYDSDEWMFPGRHLLDGTIKGALKAGMEIYPDNSSMFSNIEGSGFGCSPKGCLIAFFLLPIILIKNLVKWIVGLFKKR